MKCWAGWASEDKMRDQLKIKESVPYAICPTTTIQLLNSFDSEFFEGKYQ